jgi:cardiolipin synthase A/B
MLRAQNMDPFLTLHGLVVMAGLLTYVVTAHLLEQRRHPTAAIAWVLFMVLLPYAALPMFLAFGSRKLARPRSARGQTVEPLAPAGPAHAGAGRFVGAADAACAGPAGAGRVPRPAHPC